MLLIIGCLIVAFNHVSDLISCVDMKPVELILAS